MDNLGTLCLFGILAIVALFLLPRMLGGGRALGSSRRVTRTYNDPAIGSRASFGAPERPEYDAPEIRSRAGFGGLLRRPSAAQAAHRTRSNRRGGVLPRGRSSSVQNVNRPSNRRVDSPKIRSRASFGRKRK